MLTLDIKVLRQVVDLDEFGQVVWLPRPRASWEFEWNVENAGQRVFTRMMEASSKRPAATILGVRYFEHEVQHALREGKWPEICEPMGPTTRQEWRNTPKQVAIEEALIVAKRLRSLGGRPAGAGTPQKAHRAHYRASRRAK